MSGELRQQVLVDLAMTVQSDWGQNVRLTDPETSQFLDLVGNTNDIHFAIDPQTGMPVSGRTVHVTLLISEVRAFFGQLPDKLWEVEFQDLGYPLTLRVKEPPMPDETLGIVLLTLGK